MVPLVVWVAAVAFVAGGDRRGFAGGQTPSQSQLRRELEQHSSYHRKNNHFSEVASILDQLRRTSAVGAPDATRDEGGAPIQNEAGNPGDESELSRNGGTSRDLFGGDMVLTVDQARLVLENAKAEAAGRPPQRRKRKVARDKTLLWPTNVIYYTFDDDMEQSTRSIVHSAIKAWEDNTCLRFQEGTGRGDYITFIEGSGCYSHVGRSGGQQVLSVGYGCAAVGVAAHEIAHALGYWHEQNRYDRSNYISIEKENIYGMALMNFMRIPSAMMNDYGVPYDLGSVMHYGSKAFSSRRSLNSIQTLDRNYQNTIGQRQRLSFIDVKQMNLAYCSGVCQSRLPCQHDGYPDPAGGGANCNRCRCPLGFGGAFCEDVDQSDAGCGGVITAATSWRTVSVSLPTRRCTWLLKAPKGSHVVVEVTNVNLRCREACSGFLEVKKGPYFAQTGSRFCCTGSWSNPITSVGTEMSLIYRAEPAKTGITGVAFRFRTDAATGASASRPAPADTFFSSGDPTSASISSGRSMADSEWSEWGAWSQCSASCGGCGFVTRRRDCAGGSCGTGLTTQRRSCNVAVCTGTSAVIDSWCRFNAKTPCPKEMHDAPPAAHPRAYFQGEPHHSGSDARSENTDQIRQRRQKATSEADNCGTKATYYMCARSNPFFARLMTPDEMKKRVLSGGWNRSRISAKTGAPCCDGFEQRGDICVQRT